MFYTAVQMEATSLVSKGQGLAAVTDVEAQERITVGINWVDTHSGGCHGCSLYHLELPRLRCDDHFVGGGMYEPQEHGVNDDLYGGHGLITRRSYTIRNLSAVKLVCLVENPQVTNMLP